MRSHRPFPTHRDAGPRGTNWIISRRDDLLWFIGPAAISYLALGLMAAGFPITPIYLTWFLAVDGPHVMGTVTRTYMDKRERKRLGWFLWIIVPFCVIGPRDGMGRPSVALLSLRGVLAALPHRETAHGFHDVVEGQEQGAGSLWI